MRQNRPPQARSLLSPPPGLPSAALYDNGSATNFETPMRKKPVPELAAIIVVAPMGIRDSVAIPMSDESQMERDRREVVFHAILDASQSKTAKAAINSRLRRGRD